jgi:phage shock protein PspC (stress-responsive transcriptional regulator)
MNKTVQANIGGFVFFLDEEAYSALEHYLKSLRKTFRNEDGADEIINDIEIRIAELFKEYLGNHREVVSTQDVNKAIEIMGKPEDLDEETTESKKDFNDSFQTKTKKRIFRDPENRVLGGVAAGLASYLDIDPVIIRILFVISLFTGVGVIVYLVLWIVIPEAKSTADKLMMKGENINIENIEKAIKKEFNEVKKKLEEAGKAIDEKSIQSSANNLGKALEQIVLKLFEIIKTLLKFVFKFLGFSVLIVLAIAIFSLSVSLLGSGINISGLRVGPIELMEYTQALFVNETHLWLFFAGLIGLTALVVFSIISLSIQLIFNHKWYNPAWNSLLSMIAFLSIGTLVFSGVWLAGAFSNEARYTLQEEVSEISINDTIHFSANTNMQLEDYGWDKNFYWVAEEGNQYLRRVSVRIEKNKSEQTLVEFHKKSKGRTKADARTAAKEILYSYQRENNAFQFDNYFQLAENQRFRMQELDIKVFIPEGQIIHFDESMIDISKYTRKHQDSKDYELVGNYWKMGSSGLECLSCKIN